MKIENNQDERKIILRSLKLQEVLDRGDYCTLLGINGALKIISKDRGLELASIVQVREGDESSERLQLHYDPYNLRQVIHVLELRDSLDTIGQNYCEFPSRYGVAYQMFKFSEFYAKKLLGGKQ